MKKALTLTYRTSLWLVNRIIEAKHLKIRKSVIFGLYTCLAEVFKTYLKMGQNIRTKSWR